MKNVIKSAYAADLTCLCNACAADISSRQIASYEGEFDFARSNSPSELSADCAAFCSADFLE